MYALDANGSVRESQPDNPTATTRTGITLTSAVSIAANDGGIVVLRTGAGTVWTFGRNGFHGCGPAVASTDNQCGLTKITGLSHITAIALAGSTEYALDSAGHVWVWGANNSAEFGDGTTSTGSANPRQILGLNGVSQIAATDTSAYALVK